MRRDNEVKRDNDATGTRKEYGIGRERERDHKARHLRPRTQETGRLTLPRPGRPHATTDTHHAKKKIFDQRWSQQQQQQPVSFPPRPSRDDDMSKLYSWRLTHCGHRNRGTLSNPYKWGREGVLEGGAKSPLSFGVRHS